MWTQVKICGIRSLEDAYLCADAGADYLGLNFYPESPRFVPWQAALKIAREVSGTVRLVGLFVNPHPAAVFRAICRLHLSAVQLYGVPRSSWAKYLPVPVFWPIRLGADAVDLHPPRLRDWLLLDSHDARLLGGTGKVFCWERIPNNLCRRRLILAGGLRPENVRRALEAVRPAVVDVASGVESSPGRKDPLRVRAFVGEVVRYNLEKLIMEGQ